MRTFLLALLFLVSSMSTAAQTRGACTPGTATGTLDAGDVRAGLFNNGNLFFGSSATAASYVVPAASGKSPLYAAGLWVGGTVDGDVRVAAATYDRFAFRPGPLNADGTAPNPSDCSAYDRIFVVSAADIAAYEATGTTTPDLADWPVAWGAEAVDGDGVPGNYNLSGGDRPRLYGTQTAFWVMNDVAAPASAIRQSSPAPIGLEVQVTAAAFDSPLDAFAQATLYRFRLVKRAPGVLADARISFFADPDLGYAADDYVGVDVERGMGFVYNADNEDTGDATGYGVNPPAQGFDLLTGIGSHMFFVSGVATPQVDPLNASEVYFVQQGRWTDGTPMTTGGDGYQESGPETVYAFPGDPVTDQFWSEVNANGTGLANSPGDRRSVVSTPALTLTPGVPVDVVLALPFGQGANHLDSITQLRAASDAIQAAYDANLLFPVAGETTAPTASALALSAPRPNPTAGAAEVALTLPAAGTARVAVVDVLGREVAVVHHGALAAGTSVLRLPAGLAPGVYVVVAEAAEARVTQRLTVAR